MQKDELLIYAERETARLHYITGLIAGELLGLRIVLTTRTDDYLAFQGAKLCYHTHALAPGQEIHIIPAGLLLEKGINSHQLHFTDFDGTRAFFPVYGKTADFPFDLFSASFYLVSRYEEYLPYMRDGHGRFSPSGGIALQQGFLGVPVVNRWALSLGRLLSTRFPGLRLQPPVYKFVPTIDVDAAWAYRNKGLIRTIGGYLKDLASRDLKEALIRTRVLLGSEPDPFDTFEILFALHARFGLKPWYFILFAGYGVNDKNIPTSNDRFRILVKSLADYAYVGIHPSYASNTNPGLLKKETDMLSGVLKREITASRQHFLKLSFPETYRNLVNADITDDYSMGFASHPGFRAGICSPFKWYDLEAEAVMPLTIHPFTLMEGTLRDYMQVDATDAMDYIRPLVDAVRSVNGTFISLWHNESMSEQKRWKGWSRVYEELLQYAAP